MTLEAKIGQHMARLYPALKPYQVERAVNKYIEQTLIEIKRSISAYQGDNTEDVLSIKKTELTASCGRIAISGKKQYLYDVMSRNENTRLLNSVFRGNQGIYHRAVLNPIYEIEIYQRISGATMAPTPVLQTGKQKFYINSLGLLNYLANARIHVNQPNKSAKYYQKLNRNILDAQMLLNVIKSDASGEYIEENWEAADTGRVYARGNTISLQRVSSEVRHAALGQCWKYDFQAHSYAILLSLAEMINPLHEFPMLADYIRYRAAWRTRLAKLTGASEGNIKAVFTSLGFGANIVKNPYTAINKLLNKDQYQKLISDSTFEMFYNELLEANKLVSESPEFQGNFEIGNCKFTEVDPVTGKKKSRAQRLSWIYQAMEAVTLKQFIEIVEQRDGQTPIMTVHDCAYYKTAITTDTLIDAQYLIRQVFAAVKMDHKKIYPIGQDPAQAPAVLDLEQEWSDHRERMIAEEQAAKNYVNRWSDPKPDPTAFDPIEYERRRHAQFLRDVAHAKPMDDDEYEYEYDVNNPDEMY